MHVSGRIVFSSEKCFFLALTSSNSNGYFAIVLKFSVKQSNLIRKKSESVVSEIMNINVDFRIFVKVSHSLLLEKQQNTNAIKNDIFFENCGHNFVKNAMILKCTKIQTKILISGKIEAPKSSFWDCKLHHSKACPYFEY